MDPRSDQRKNGTVPPSTDHDAPATFEACSEQRKTITDAISSGSPRRPTGTFAPAASSSSSRLVPDLPATWAAMPSSPTHSSVAVGPGATALTSTPLPAYWSAKTRDSDSCAAFVTAYAALRNDGRLPADDETLTILPQPRSAIFGAATRISRSDAITFSSH